MIYVDDCLFFSKEDKYIDALVEKMRDQKFELEYKDQSINGLLGLYISKTSNVNDKTIHFKMDQHIDFLMLIKVLNFCTPKDNTAIQTPLGTYIDGASIKETNRWSYTATVGMLQYLSSNEHSGI